MNGQDTVASPKPAATISVAYTGTAGTTAAVGGASTTDSNVVRVIATTDCFITITTVGTAAVATSGMYLPALTPEYFSCPPSAKVSAIQVSAGGTIYVTPMQ